MIQDIDINRLMPHSENSNRMNAKTLAKLRRHIERTGKYEPLIVRPHPTEAGMFQVINGHHRLQALKALGKTEAICAVWEVDDKQARLYLATLNRLSGEDIPERRALLLGSLLENFEVKDLADLLPENQDQLNEIKRLSEIDLDEFISQLPSGMGADSQVILEFFLSRDDAKKVNLVLDLIAHRHPELNQRSKALVHLACVYLAINEG